MILLGHVQAVCIPANQSRRQPECIANVLGLDVALLTHRLDRAQCIVSNLYSECKNVVSLSLEAE
jgi:hypothetical protein